jgi:hypothetical protein
MPTSIRMVFAGSARERTFRCCASLSFQGAEGLMAHDAEAIGSKLRIAFFAPRAMVILKQLFAIRY